MDVAKHNQAAWDGYVDQKNRWTMPVSGEILARARKGDWQIVLTPSRPVPHHWFPKLKGCRVLGLAAGGGQQGPVLAALGADVTILDNSEKQLLQDRQVCKEFGLRINTLQGDMRDLSRFDPGSFDLVFNPCSVVFVDNVRKVWQECYRVLHHGGVLMAGLINPLAFQLEKREDGFFLKYKQPYSDLHSLPEEKRRELISAGEALEFGHSLSDQIGGQLQAGFLLSDMYEDHWHEPRPIDAFMPSFIATRAVKPTNF